MWSRAAPMLYVVESSPSPSSISSGRDASNNGCRRIEKCQAQCQDTPQPSTSLMKHLPARSGDIKLAAGLTRLIDPHMLPYIYYMSPRMPLRYINALLCSASLIIPYKRPRACSTCSSAMGSFSTLRTCPVGGSPASVHVRIGVSA